MFRVVAIDAQFNLELVKNYHAILLMVYFMFCSYKTLFHNIVTFLSYVILMLKVKIFQFELHGSNVSSYERCKLIRHIISQPLQQASHKVNCTDVFFNNFIHIHSILGRELINVFHFFCF